MFFEENMRNQDLEHKFNKEDSKNGIIQFPKIGVKKINAQCAEPETMPSPQHGAEWSKVSFESKLTVAFVNKYKQHMDWALVSNNAHLTIDVINAFEEHLDFSTVSKRVLLPEDMLERHIQKLDFKGV